MTDLTLTRTIHITRQDGVTVSALIVPGGLLYISDASTESGNGIAVGLSTTFVPMSDVSRQMYLNKLAQEQEL
jgi:hypothetical protein